MIKNIYKSNVGHKIIIISFLEIILNNSIIKCNIFLDRNKLYWELIYAPCVVPGIAMQNFVSA